MSDTDPTAAPVQADVSCTSQDNKDASNDSNVTTTVHEADIQYPSGIILVLIVSGLLLSMFLVALDMVSTNILFLGFGPGGKSFMDDSANRPVHHRALLPQLSHALPPSSAAWRTLAGTAVRSS